MSRSDSEARPIERAQTPAQTRAKQLSALLTPLLWLHPRSRVTVTAQSLSWTFSEPAKNERVTGFAFTPGPSRRPHLKFERRAKTSMLTRRSTLSLLTGLLLAAVASVGAGRGPAFAQTPAPTGQVAVQITLQAGATAAARTWRFEVVSSAGTVVQTLSLGTNGAAPTASEASTALPYGAYTVRQILGNDTKTACDAASFYEVASPAGAQTTFELGSPRVTVAFVIRPCAALPSNPQFQAPIDTVTAPPPPIDEVRGDRAAGPSAPLPPATGSSAQSPIPASSPSLLLVILGVSATLIPSVGFALAHAGQRSKR